MRRLKNEQGYALLVVLLTISIIFSVAGLLASKSITSAKQINSTDEYVRLIDLAEMGTTNARVRIEQSVANQLEDDILRDTYELDTGFDLKNYLIAINQHVLNDVGSTKSVNFGDERGHQYKVDIDGSLDTDGKSLIYTVNSVGLNSDKEEYRLKYNVVIKGSLDGGLSESGSGGSTDLTEIRTKIESERDIASNYIVSYWPVEYTEYYKDGEVYQNDITVKGSEEFNGNTYIGGNGLTVSNADPVVVKGSLFTQNNTSISDSNMIVNGYMYANNLPMTNSTLKVIGNLDVKNEITINPSNKDNVELEVSGSVLTSKINLSNNAEVNIGGSLIMDGASKIDGDMTVGGNAEFNSNFDSMKGNLIIKGNAKFADINFNGGGLKGKIIVEGKLDKESAFYNKNLSIIRKITDYSQTTDDGYIYYFDRESGDSEEGIVVIQEDIEYIG